MYKVNLGGVFHVCFAFQKQNLIVNTHRDVVVSILERCQPVEELCYSQPVAWQTIQTVGACFYIEIN